MSNLNYPFPMEIGSEYNGDDLKHTDLFGRLPSLLQEQASNNLHLLEYLHMMPVSKVGIPEYLPKLKRGMGDPKSPNVIYPVGENNFIHVMTDFQDSRNHYIQIEPISTISVDKLVRDVENNCVDNGDNLADFNIEGDKEKQLCHYIDQVTTTIAQREPGRLEKYLRRFLGKDKKQIVKIYLSKRELNAVKYEFIRDKLRLGIIEPLIQDPYIEDIGCSGLGQIYLEHKIFGALKSIITFNALEELDRFVLRLAEKIQKPVNYKQPICDSTLPDGSRINIVYGRDVSKRGSNFSIRKFAGVPLSIFDLVDFGTLNYDIAAYLSMIVSHDMNMFVAGESASGKTSLLNALTAFLDPSAKIVSIEDTPELQVPQQNWIREVVSSNKGKKTAGDVTTFDLLRAALRQRPNEIIVGEIRGPEGNVAFQAMQTGHAVMSTFHASSVTKLIQRLTASPISVPRTYIDNLNVAVMMSTVRLPSGRLGRRITEIAEIVGFDSESQSFNIVEAFRWDPEVDKFEFTGRMASYMLEKKVAPRMGISEAKRQQIYQRLDQRARLFKKLHLEQGITGFYQVLDVLSKAKEEGAM
jgi:flagellar protein FlaI